MRRSAFDGTFAIVGADLRQKGSAPSGTVFDAFVALGRLR
jgi:hypothetical protein